MAINSGIVNFGQQASPLVRGLESVAQGAQAIQQGRQRQQQQEMMQNQQNAYRFASQAFLDSSDPEATSSLLMQSIDADPKTAFTIIESMRKGGDVGAAEAEFNRLTSGLSDEDKKGAVRIKLGLDPRAVGSSALTTATTGQTDVVAESQANIAGAKEEAKAVGKAKGEAKSAPLIAKTKASIASAIQSEKDAAKGRGEKESELRLAKAALPSLIGVVDSLKTLAPVATSTYSGKAFDLLAKETGFGATKGAEARAKFVAIIDNQVLPLLKQTFGAAFTATEGESLKKTMGDPDGSPGEKIAQLDSFIENKIREIEVKERELGKSGEASTFTSKSGITFTVE